MGHMSAVGMAELRGVSEETISWHLRFNHFPAIDGTWVPVALTAINKAVAGEWDDEVDPPDGFNSNEPLTVHELVGGLHLEAFVDVLARESDEN